MANKRNFTQEEIEDIVTKFKSGTSIESLQKEFHTKKIRDILILNNCEIKQGGPRKNSGRKFKYSFNENYFEKIDSFDKAYWLGFIAADGYITKSTNGQNVLGINLGEKEPLEKFKFCINSDHPINLYNSTNPYNDTISNAFRIILVSNKTVNDIEKLGIVERKSLILKFPVNISKEYISHYIRGYFDGDGSIYKIKNKYYCEILGTEDFLKGLSDQLLDVNIIQFPEKCNKTSIWRLRFSSSQVFKLYNYMYKDCKDIYLSRKKKKFEQFINKEVQRL